MERLQVHVRHALTKDDNLMRSDVESEFAFLDLDSQIIFFQTVFLFQQRKTIPRIAQELITAQEVVDAVLIKSKDCRGLGCITSRTTGMDKVAFFPFLITALMEGGLTTGCLIKTSVRFFAVFLDRDGFQTNETVHQKEKRFVFFLLSRQKENHQFYMPEFGDEQVSHSYDWSAQQDTIE